MHIRCSQRRKRSVGRMPSSGYASRSVTPLRRRHLLRQPVCLQSGRGVRVAARVRVWDGLLPTRECLLEVSSTRATPVSVVEVAGTELLHKQPTLIGAQLPSVTSLGKVELLLAVCAATYAMRPTLLEPPDQCGVCVAHPCAAGVAVACGGERHVVVFPQGVALVGVTVAVLVF